MTSNASRREFIKRASAIAATGVTTPMALNLAAMASASAATAQDYKALVCVYLDGGNDHANTLVPWDALSYESYRAQRPLLLPQRASLEATVLPTVLPGGRQYALSSQLAQLKPLYEAKKLAVLLNIGNLVEPVTLAQVRAGAARVPPKLGSHNDQRAYFQSSLPEGGTTGWGGRMGDLLAAGNRNAIFTCVGVGGGGVMLSGNQTLAYRVGRAGAIPITGVKQPQLFGSSACRQALEDLLTTPPLNLFANEYTATVRRSIETERILTPALRDVPRGSFTDDGLSNSLAMVARLIATRDVLGVKRQVFFVSLGGFDTHDGLLGRHPRLLDAVGTAMSEFQAALKLMGVESQVTTFTASDFGRTVNQNDDGSDHGWGSMHFVMGGAVNGGRYHGDAPTLGAEGLVDLGRGRLMPTRAFDQLSHSLGSWFGLSASDLLQVLPNIGNFNVAQRNLGVMKSG